MGISSLVTSGHFEEHLKSDRTNLMKKTNINFIGFQLASMRKARKFDVLNFTDGFENYSVRPSDDLSKCIFRNIHFKIMGRTL